MRQLSASTVAAHTQLLLEDILAREDLLEEPRRPAGLSRGPAPVRYFVRALAV